MDINKSATFIKKKTTIKNISKVIVVILLVFIILQVFILVALGNGYIQDFLSDTGTAAIGTVDIQYSSMPEKMQAIFLCTLNLANMALGIVGSILLWGFFNQIASKNKPFLPGQGNRLQTVAILLMMSALLVACCNAWALALSAQQMHGVVLIWTFLVSLAGGMLYPLIFFCMAMIFNYGMGLQIESDETL